MLLCLKHPGINPPFLLAYILKILLLCLRLMFFLFCSRSPCPKSARCKLFIGPPKSKGTELPASVSNVTAQAGKVVAVTQTEEIAAAGNVVQPTPMPNVHAYV